MTKTIKGVLLNTQTNKISPYSFEYEEQKNGKTTFLPNMYALLGCDCIDIVSRKFGKHQLDIICDDEGLLKDNKVSILTYHNNKLVETIVGNVFICNCNDDGESISLTDNEIEALKEQIRYIDDCDEFRKVLVATI